MTDRATPTQTPGPIWRTRLARLALAIYWPLLFTATHWPSLTLTGKPPPPRANPASLLQGDKVMHLAAFGLLAILLILAWPTGRQRTARANRLAATGIALGYAVVDEVTQSLAFERTVSASDLLANAIAIVGVLLLALTPIHPQTPRSDRALRSARRRMMGVVAGIFLGGLLLALSGTINRETYAVHFVGAAACTLALLRVAPVWPNQARFGAALACAAVGGSIIATELVQAFAGLPFSHAEAFFGHVGLLLAMSLWSIRLALIGPALHDERAPTATTTPTDAPQHDSAPADPPRA